jgi:hypothetical protein
MAYQSLGLGTTAGDGTGDTIRVGGDKINDNFVELYTLLGTGSALSSGISATSTVVTLVTPSILGVASFADGSVSAPAITNTGDSNTGIYFSAADTVSVTTGGTKRVDIDSTGLDVTGAITATTSITATTTMQGTTITAETAFVPDASDGAALGTTALEFSDLFLADGAVINFGDDQDVTLTHIHNTGLRLNVNRVIEFYDASQYIGASSTTVLSIAATDEIDLTATLVDINANVEISGTATTTGVHTFSAIPLFPNDTVSTGDLQADCVTAAKIGDDVIDSEHYAANSIDEEHMANDSVGSAELKTLSTLLIKNSGGSTLATFHTAGA